jgi:hypothetical protein
VPWPSSSARHGSAQGPTLRSRLAARSSAIRTSCHSVLESRGRRDIRPGDFIESRVTFDMAVPVPKLLDSETVGEAMPEIRLSIEGRPSILHGPALQVRPTSTYDLVRYP